jgi:hypothetical protein
MTRVEFAKKVLAMKDVHWMSIRELLCVSRSCVDCEFKRETELPCRDAYISDWARSVLGEPKQPVMEPESPFIKALSVLYFGSDDDLRYLAENEYSGCSGTQRECLTELHDYLVKVRKND